MKPSGFELAGLALIVLAIATALGEALHARHLATVEEAERVAPGATSEQAEHTESATEREGEP